MLDWTRLTENVDGLELPGLIHPTLEMWTATAEDGGDLFASLTGDGTPESARMLQVFYVPVGNPLQGPGWDASRGPELSEILAAIHLVVPEGAMMLIPPVVSGGPSYEDPPLSGPAGITVLQVGVKPGTPAATRWEIGTGGQLAGNIGAMGAIQ